MGAGLGMGLRRNGDPGQGAAGGFVDPIGNDRPLIALPIAPDDEFRSLGCRNSLRSLQL